MRVGGAWRALPAGFPPWRTVYGWFRRWIEKGLFESLMRALARRQRRRCGRRATPCLAIIDTHSRHQARQRASAALARPLPAPLHRGLEDQAHGGRQPRAVCPLR
ncbi:transposase [Methylorubrum extorquens]